MIVSPDVADVDALSVYMEGINQIPENQLNEFRFLRRKKRIHKINDGELLGQDDQFLFLSVLLQNL